MNDLTANTDQIEQRLHSLEQQVEALERRLEIMEPRLGAVEHPPAASWPHPLAEVESALAAASAAVEPPAQPGNLFPVLGKALLGIAGAYVLRAVEETSAFPRPIVAAAGIAYAFLWLLWAARVRGGPRFTSSIYAGTSALILAPMLWELTLRFNVLPPVAAAAVTGAFALTAIVLAVLAPASYMAQSDLKQVLRVALIAASALALALAIASHAFLPFLAVLLLLAAATEFVPGCACVPDATAFVALAADAAIWVLFYVYYVDPGARSGYPALNHVLLLAPGIAIFALFALSVCVKTVLHARPIAAFATIQVIISFLLASVGIADFVQPDGTTILGVACLLLSPVCYALAFTVFARAPDRRNTHVFAAWAAALLLSGSFLCLPPLLSILLLAAAALAATRLGRQQRWKVFKFYAMVFLLAASAASGLLAFLVSALVGAPAGVPAPGVWFVAVCAVLCYALAQPRQAEPWIPQALHLGFAALAAGSVAALFIDGLVTLIALRVMPAAHHLALIRTVTLCAAALLLVSGGAHWSRRELTRLGYAALALVAIKLVTEDLRHGHLAYIAASIFLLAFTLIAAPRVARIRQKT